MFREQVSTVSNWFDRWSPCEQTVAIVALLRRLQPTQARFVATILHRQLSDCPELRRTEILANDPSKIELKSNSFCKLLINLTHVCYRFRCVIGQHGIKGNSNEGFAHIPAIVKSQECGCETNLYRFDFQSTQVRPVGPLYDAG